MGMQAHRYALWLECRYFSPTRGSARHRQASCLQQTKTTASTNPPLQIFAVHTSDALMPTHAAKHSRQWRPDRTWRTSSSSPSAAIAADASCPYDRPITTSAATCTLRACGGTDSFRNPMRTLYRPGSLMRSGTVSPPPPCSSLQKAQLSVASWHGPTVHTAVPPQVPRAEAARD